MGVLRTHWFGIVLGVDLTVAACPSGRRARRSLIMPPSWAGAA